VNLPAVPEINRDGRVIGQVGADAGQVRHDGNAEFTKVPGRADARPHEQGRAAVRASAHDDPAGADLAARSQPHADGPVPLNQHAAHRGVTAHRKIRPGQAGRQVGQRGADALTVERVDRQRGHPDGAGSVRVRHPLAAGLLQRGQAGPGHVGELIVAVPPDRQRAGVAVPRGRPEVRVVLQPGEKRQHFAERPPVVTGLRPGVVVRRMAAQRDRRIG